MQTALRHLLPFVIVFLLCAWGHARPAAIGAAEALWAAHPPAAATPRPYLLEEVDRAWRAWRERYEAFPSAEALGEHQAALREQFQAMLGPWPEAAPLQAQVVGEVARDGFRAEKILFQSMPGFHVAALLFLPDAAPWTPPYPGVLVPCGHSAEGKAAPAYQQLAALLALNGMAALVFDPIDQGERLQLHDPQGIWGTKGHTLLGVGSILLGRNTASFEVWDGMRALDYLAARPEVDAQRLGCSGNSGGGTQTAFLMSLDSRIRAAAPSCYINRASRQLANAPGDAEQNIFGQLAWGMEHADFLMMRAPMPVLISARTEDFFDIEATWTSFRYAKRYFTQLGHAERVDIVEAPGRHGLGQRQREAIVRWMARWLRGEHIEAAEPDIQVLTPGEAQCTPTGQVLDIEGAVSAYEWNAAYAARLAQGRAQRWEALEPAQRHALVWKRIGLDGPPHPAAQWEAGGGRREPGAAQCWTMHPRPGTSAPPLSLLALYPAEETNTLSPMLYVHSQGNQAALEMPAVRDWLERGGVVYCFEPTGVGRTAQRDQKKFMPHIGPDWEDYFAAYCLGKSFVGMRAEDLMACMQFVTGREKRALYLCAQGHAAVPALHAAFLAQADVASLALHETIDSWTEVVNHGLTRNQLINAVHGALLDYDLPLLRADLGQRLHMGEIIAPGSPAN